MALVISTCDKKLLFNGKQAQQYINKYYLESAQSKTINCRWYADFKGGRTM